jgi:serine-type D-Ala-D-Ala carboxypeptidase/endopeptidase (penicillin-binding protein 4)
MKRIAFFLTVLLTVNGHAQLVSVKLAYAYKLFMADSQLRSAISSLYVIDANSNKVVFDRNSRVGLATASTMKIITSATAYELLGKGFRYTTEFGYNGQLQDGNLRGNLYIRPSGDPTLGSWRWKQTSEDSVMYRVISAFRNTPIKKYNALVVDAFGWEGEAIPGGWTWDDLGQYYGAPADALNWHENQFDMTLQSGDKPGDPVVIKNTRPHLYTYNYISYVKSASKGSGDNSYMYLPLNSTTGVVRGTIPAGEKNFVISGAMPSGKNQFLATLSDSLSRNGIQSLSSPVIFDSTITSTGIDLKATIIHREESPELDSMVFWFLRKSINLYGEALVKTIAFKSNQAATTENGTKIIRDYWVNKNIGIDQNELNNQDGSGLSPQDRITTHAQVAILKYAKKQPWFAGYYLAFPEYNGMKMKSGTINRVKGFCGYQVSSNGHEYIFSFLVNNYNGSATTLVQKMYKVLDLLKQY